MQDDTKSKSELLQEIESLKKRVRVLEAGIQRKQQLTEQLMYVYKQSAVGMVLIALNGHLLRVNSAFCEMLGYEMNELLALNMFSITHPEELEANRASLYKFLTGICSSASNEKRFLHKSGKVIWGFITISLIHDEHGSPLYFVCQIQNITERKQVEEELLVKQNIAKALLNTPYEATLITDTEGIILDANEVFAHRFDLALEEVKGENIMNILPPNLAYERRNKIEQLFKTKKPICFEDERTGKQFDNTLYPVLDSNGEIVQLVLFSKDITERKISEAILKVREKQQIAVSELGHYAIVQPDINILLTDVLDLIRETFDIEYCCISEFIPESSKLILRSSKAADGKLIHVPCEAGNLIDLNDSLEGLVVKAEDTIILSVHSPYPEKSFLERYQFTNALAIPIRFYNDFYGVLNIYSTEHKYFSKNDVSFCEALAHILAAAIKRKKDEQILAESEERYRKLVEVFPDAVFVQDKETILFANYAAVHLVRASDPLALLGGNILNYIRTEERAIVEEKFHRMQNTNNYVYLKDIQLVRLDHSQLDVEITATTIQYNGIHAILTVIRDMTEHKRAEESNRMLAEALEYDKLKTEFFSNISHELRTPISVIFSALQLLKLNFKRDLSEDISRKLGRYLDPMQQNCYRLMRLINNIIDITKIDTKYYELNLENQDIIAVTEKIVRSVAAFIEAKEISLHYKTEIKEKVIACDPDKIERILLNLLSNAVKFTKPGGSIDVHVFLKNEQVVICVKDTGVGIPPDKHALIFERFRQVDKSLTRNHEGSGIGLSLVKSLIELHGGTIRVESTPNKGSTFYVTLPDRVIEESPTHNRMDPGNRQIELINIEFSDIYI